MTAIDLLKQQTIKSIHEVSEMMPGVIIIHNLETSSVVYMSQRGLDMLKVTLEELKDLGPDYFERFFNTEDAKNYTPKFLDFLTRNQDGEIFTFFQQVRSSPSSPWGWYLSASNVILRDETNKPILSITIAQEIDAEKSLTLKAERILKENEFIHKNLEQFSMLTTREKEVLSKLADGKTNSEIANEFFVSLHTIQTHRKTIKKKLGFNSTKDLFYFANCFDLI
jgi:DNA-binding CsgD family transcriptional regulator